MAGSRPGRADDATDKQAPARPARTGKSSGRVTPKGGGSARQAGPGRYTPPIPKDKRHSPTWYPWLLLTLLVAGLAVIVLNYVNVMPGGTSNWYLVGGIVAIVVGLGMATFYR